MINYIIKIIMVIHDLYRHVASEGCTCNGTTESSELITSPKIDVNIK